MFFVTSWKNGVKTLDPGCKILCRFQGFPQIGKFGHLEECNKSKLKSYANSTESFGWKKVFWSDKCDPISLLVWLIYCEKFRFTVCLQLKSKSTGYYHLQLLRPLTFDHLLWWKPLLLTEVALRWTSYHYVQAKKCEDLRSVGTILQFLKWRGVVPLGKQRVVVSPNNQHKESCLKDPSYTGIIDSVMSIVFPSACFIISKWILGLL